MLSKYFVRLTIYSESIGVSEMNRICIKNQITNNLFAIRNGIKSGISSIFELRNRILMLEIWFSLALYFTHSIEILICRFSVKLNEKNQNHYLINIFNFWGRGNKHGVCSLPLYLHCRIIWFFFLLMEYLGILSLLTFVSYIRY